MVLDSPLSSGTAELEGTFGETLRLVRLRRRDSQAALARLLGTSDMTVSRIERGKYPPDPSTHRPLARYLNISVAELRRILEAEQLAAREAELTAELERIRNRRAGLMSLG